MNPIDTQNPLQKHLDNAYSVEELSQLKVSPLQCQSEGGPLSLSASGWNTDGWNGSSKRTSQGPNAFQVHLLTVLMLILRLLAEVLF